MSHRYCFCFIRRCCHPYLQCRQAMAGATTWLGGVVLIGGGTQQSPWFHHPGWHLADFTSAAVRGDSAVGLPSAPPYRRHHGVGLPDRLSLAVVAVRVVRLPANGCRLQRCLLSCCMVIDGGHWVTADGFYGELTPLRAQRLVVVSLSSSENLLSSMLANNDRTCGCRSPLWRHCREVLGETSPPSSPQHCVAYRGDSSLSWSHYHPYVRCW
jgi:hypothetical protein